VHIYTPRDISETCDPF